MLPFVPDTFPLPGARRGGSHAGRSDASGRRFSPTGVSVSPVARQRVASNVLSAWGGTSEVGIRNCIWR